jgi:hypothetical protein
LGIHGITLIEGKGQASQDYQRDEKEAINEE